MNTKILLGALALCVLLHGTASAQSTEPLITGAAGVPDFKDRDGPDTPHAGNTTIHAGTNWGYLRIAGSSFVARDSTTLPTYAGSGCISTPTGGGMFTADVQLPADADVRYVRTYFYNDVSGSILTFFTEYDGAGGFTDHTTHNISGSGWNSTLSPALAVIVAPVNRSYAMNVRIEQASPDLRFCGVRIQYFY